MNASAGRVAGKVAIVTGAASGLGRATAELLAREGATVVVTDINADQARKVADSIGESAISVVHDVTDEESWVSLIGEVESRYGKLNILVNNAGIVTPGDAESTTVADYKRIMAVSMDGVFFGCKYAIPLMKKSGLSSIVNMSSIAALVGESVVAAYCAAKGAVRSYTRAVAVHCTRSGYQIRCNSVHPSGIDTPMVQGFSSEMSEINAANGVDQETESVGSRLGEPDDVAYAVLYLASDEAKFTNGTELVIDNTVTATAGVVP
ncbi:SDR family oxidoreductase [Elongatibacter sediminis]|uniref:SDR family oxidoreductase n=1 Tax=Elongatibacter sediminis TaxID=3119006 RepID=A0AAW9RM80_9GAMM